MSKISEHKKRSKSLKKKKKDKIRIQKKNREKEQAKKLEKQFQQQLAIVEQLVDAAPDSCSKCSETFSKDNDDHLDNWQISIDETGIVMICEKCIVSE